MPLFIAILLGLSGLLVVIYPLLGLEREMPDTVEGSPLADVAERERSARDALREVEFDHRLGNLDDSDYQALRARYERRALAALKVRYQREQELEALIERQLDTLRTRKRNDGGIDHSGSTLGGEQPSAGTHHRAGSRNGAENRGTRTRAASGPLARRRRGGRL
ncbi:MAG TPA: hypothetical protein VFN11_16515 [Ktedonobacterales bacterium]|nr:hypothetical protein [Ktedonobacterales bacterium]